MASEQPLLIFPSFQRAERDKGFNIGKPPHAPDRSQQIKRLGPQFKRLQQAFEAERLAFQIDFQGLFPEFVLVIETRGRIEDFYRAAQGISIGWLGEIDLDDLEPDDDFYYLDKNGQRNEKRLDGRLYLGMTDQQALEQLLQLWNRFKNNQLIGKGNAKWRDLFTHAKDIRRWGAKDQLLSSSILENWAQSIEDDPNAPVNFRVELWYPKKLDNSSCQAHQQAEENTVRQAIIATGGEVLANMRIDKIHFHALKGRIPVSVARSALLVRAIDESKIAPGQKAAAPDHTGTGATDRYIWTRGTSNATALATRTAAKLYEVLEELQSLPGCDCINRDTTAPLLKALITHSATWPDEAIGALKTVVPKGKKQKRGVARFLGYGIADPARIEACAAQRATVLGAGLLQQDEAHEYELPFPVELSNTTEWRRLIITLAWLTPVNPAHRVYRKAKLSFQPPKDLLAVDRQHADWQQTQKGTVQHEVLEGKKASVFQDGDSLRIKIAAQGDTGQNFDEAIPYGLAVTLEVAEQSDIPIYERVREKLAIRIIASA